MTRNVILRKFLPGNAGMIKSGDVERENKMFYINLMRG